MLTLEKNENSAKKHKVSSKMCEKDCELGVLKEK